MSPTSEISDACTAALGLDTDIDIDAMYNEFSSAKVVLERIVQSQACAGEKWQTLSETCGSQVPKNNMFKLVAYILSMLSSNAFSERVFSLMNTEWRTEKNRPSAALITSELQVFVNFVCSCSAFYDVVLKEQKLPDAAASNKNIHGSRKLPIALVFQLSFPTSDSELNNIKDHYFSVFVL